MVVWSATGNKVSCRYRVTIVNGEVATIPNPNMIHMIFALGLTVVVNQFIRRSVNEDLTNR